LALIPILFVVSIVSFGLVDLAPGDAATTLAGENATPEQIEQMRETLGLNESLPARYGSFVEGAVSLDLGSSTYSSQEVTTIIGHRIWPTLSLVAVALIFAALLGVPAGVYAALRRGQRADRIISATAGLGLAIPSFVGSIFLLRWFALSREWFPAGGFVPISENPLLWVKHLVLPAIALSLFPASELARLVRTSVADTLSRDYIQTAIAKGLPRHRVLLKHTLKNAAIPIVTVIGVQTGRLLGGSVIIEEIFNIPGLGSLTVSSVQNRDVPIIQGVVLLSAVLVILINLIVDLSYGYFNPKLRH
jgi:peptide/nickel transport system permease protein